jgi:hypothetical protein
MNRGFSFAPKPSSINISTRNKRLLAVKVIARHLERIRDAEWRCIDSTPHMPSSLRCEAELRASIIEDAIFILDTIQ